MQGINDVNDLRQLLTIHFMYSKPFHELNAPSQSIKQQSDAPSFRGLSKLLIVHLKSKLDNRASR